MNCIQHTGYNANGALYDDVYCNINTSHRIFVANHGPIPAGHVIYRTCKNKSCVEPTHMFSAPRQMHNYGEIVWNDRQGEMNNNAVLEVEDIIEIRRLRNSGWKYQDIGKQYGVSRQQIWRICKRMAWNHV